MGLLWSSQLPPDATIWAAQAAPRLMGTALALTLHRPDAEDLVQDTIIKALTQWGKVARADSVDAYVRKIMVNTFISGRRRRCATEIISHEFVITASQATPSVESSITDRAALDTLLTTLPPRHRAVLVLRYYQDLPDPVIADILGCSDANVRVMAKRALDAIRPRMSDAVTA